MAVDFVLLLFVTFSRSLEQDEPEDAWDNLLATSPTVKVFSHGLWLPMLQLVVNLEGDGPSYAAIVQFL